LNTANPTTFLLPCPQRTYDDGRTLDRPRDCITVAGAPEPLLHHTLNNVVSTRLVDRDQHPWLLCRTASNFAIPSATHIDQAYRLSLAPPATSNAPTAVIEASGEQGLRYALITLSQLLHHQDPHLPSTIIEDWPAFPHRGVMLDISRNRVPTMEHLFNTINTLATLKFNHLQLYIEHTFAYRGHEQAWQDSSPLTPEQVQQLDTHCRARGIALAANQNCFGHLTKWLQLPRYAALAETQGDWLFQTSEGAIKHSGPFSLCPIDPRSTQLIDDLLAQLLPHFSSRLINIGCDETFDLGAGRSAEQVAQRGRAAVYFDFVHHVVNTVRRHGFKPMFWADIALHHPESIDRIPSDMISLAWGDEPDSPFSRWCQLLVGAGRETWVCPGTSSWCSFVGRTTERRKNLTAAAEQGLQHGASGYLVTDWGDLGHRQQWPIALHGIAEAANAAWNSDHRRSWNPLASSWHVFNDPTLRIANWLDQLGDVDYPLRQIAGRPGPDGEHRPLTNQSVIFADLQTPLADPWRPGSLDQWKQIAAKLDGLRQAIPPEIDALHIKELHHTLNVAGFAVERAILRRTPGGITPKTQRQLLDQINHIIQEYRDLWARRSRPGGLDESCGYFQRVADELTRE
jgi:hypothetical protein